MRTAPQIERLTDGFLRESQIIPALIPVSSTTLWRMVKAGSFPKPIKLSARVTAWRAREVRAWMAERAPA